jgi:hypothetical protein
MLHTVVRGESLSLIARRYGVDSWRTVYYAPQNAGFRAKCPDPNRINPGDQVFIPGRRQKGTSSGPAAQAPANQDGAGHSRQERYTDGASQAPVPMDPDAPEPASLDPAMLRDGVFHAPYKFVTFLSKVLQTSRNAVDRLSSTLGKSTDGAFALAALYESYKDFEHNENRKGVSNLLLGLGKAWRVMPENARKRAVKPVGSLIKRIPKLGDLGDIIEPLDRIDGLSAFMLLLSAMTIGDGANAKLAAQDLLESCQKNPADGARVGAELLQFFLGLIPTNMRVKMMAKMAGRKIPVLGTILVGITDLVSIASKPSDWTRWAGLGSTLAGLVPLAGTALSVLIDLGIVVGTIIDHIGDVDIGGGPSPVPEHAPA